MQNTMSVVRAGGGWGIKLRGKNQKKKEKGRNGVKSLKIAFFYLPAATLNAGEKMRWGG